ncbi:MAG TPA: SCP2 sterol-binding domain-containing protein, partial [Firmicutes bacterium]|nr:SCP2 sterol-binding domain-containing protein [Candidatus Fermentithermobacillaceae bacterium]
VVSDLKECFIGQILGPDRSLGVWSRSPALAFTVAQWIYHDITVLALEKEFKAEATTRINKETQALLRGVLQWAPGRSGDMEAPGSKVELPAGALDVTGIFAGIERRLKADPASARDIEGSYEFRLSGEGGGIFHVCLDSGLVRVGEGPLMEPALVLEASSEDFRAMVLGVLPLGALYTPGRIKVTGGIEAASRIQSLLRG